MCTRIVYIEVWTSLPKSFPFFVAGDFARRRLDAQVCPFNLHCLYRPGDGNENFLSAVGQPIVEKYRIYAATNELVLRSCCKAAHNSLFPLRRSCIVTTNQDFIILRTPMEYYPDAFVKEKRPLRTLVKITAKKKHPNLITFSFKERYADDWYNDTRPLGS